MQCITEITQCLLSTGLLRNGQINMANYRSQVWLLHRIFFVYKFKRYIVASSNVKKIRIRFDAWDNSTWQETTNSSKLSTKRGYLSTSSMWDLWDAKAHSQNANSLTVMHRIHREQHRETSLFLLIKQKGNNSDQFLQFN